MSRPANRAPQQLQAPGEVAAPPANADAYEEWRRTDHLRGPYRLTYDLLKGIRTDFVGPNCESPLIIFINARSGGLVGAGLALELSRAVGRAQVFDISEHRPDKVLTKLYDNLKQAEASDPSARAVRQRLRILVCGGDGTIVWVLSVIKKLRLQPEPPVAMMPLGTGNDLSRSFNWGPAFDPKWIRNNSAMYKTLDKIAVAQVEDLDAWRITITMPRKELLKDHPHCLSQPGAPAPPPAPPAVPNATAARMAPNIVRNTSSGLTPQPHPSLMAVRDAGSVVASVASYAATAGSAQPLPNIATSSIGSAVTTFTTATNASALTTAAVAGTAAPSTLAGPVSTSAGDEEGIGVLSGMLWNYFSVGLDAKAAWGFHSLREKRPGCTSSRMANQAWYAVFSCTSGWFCCAQPLNIKVKLEVLKPNAISAGWQTVKLPSYIKALVVVNLQSYAGGRNLWGPQKDGKKGRTKPSHNDGLVEVVGLCSGWHTSMVMGTKGKLVHAKRICQAAGVRLALQAPYVRADGEASHCYLQVDGEPWRQDIGAEGRNERPVMVEIVHAGTSKVLRNDASTGKHVQRNVLPVVVATPEAAVPLASPSATPSLPASQLLPTAGAGPSGQPTSAHWSRTVSGGRPSTASAVGSAHGGALAAPVEGAAATGIQRPPTKSSLTTAVGADAADGVAPDATHPSSPVYSPTPRTLSIELSSHGGRSLAPGEA